MATFILNLKSVRFSYSPEYRYPYGMHFTLKEGFDTLFLESYEYRAWLCNRFPKNHSSVSIREEDIGGILMGMDKFEIYLYKDFSFEQFQTIYHQLHPEFIYFGISIELEKPLCLDENNLLKLVEKE